VQLSVDLVLATTLKVLDEVEIRIEQHLIGCRGAIFDTIKTVQSHPVALAQCSRFFESNPQLRSVIAEDTAGSVAEVIRGRDPKRAAIAGQRAAELYGGSIIRKSIQDQAENYTRFILLSAKEHTS
jgi:prephenate dehydratase